MKNIILPLTITTTLFATICNQTQSKEANMYWQQSIFQEGNIKQKLKTLNSAYEKCPLQKIAIDRQIAYISTLSPKERNSKEVREDLFKLEKISERQKDVSIKHIKENQKKITILLKRPKGNGLRAVEEVGGVYRADIRFDYDSAKLKKTPLLSKVIEKISSEIDKHPNALFELEGGASSEGSATYNKNLSKKRAESLKRAIGAKYANHISISDNGENGIVCEGGFLAEVDATTGEAKCITKEDKEASRRVTIRRTR